MQYNFMFVFKQYDRQNHVWSFMTKYLRFLCKFTSWSSVCIEKQIRCWKNCWYSQIIHKCNNILQNRICFSIQPLLQLVNLHGSRRYFVIKLHTWFCLSYCLKTDIKVYCIYQYFMSINSFFNTVSVIYIFFLIFLI
jgi:hypothetical protein